MKQIFILAMLILMTGCAPTMKMIVNGRAYPTKWVKTVGDVDKSTIEEKNASLATVSSNNGKRDAVTIAYLNKNTQYLPKKDTLICTSGCENSVTAILTFNQKVEMVKRRNEVYEKGWLNDVYVAAINEKKPTPFEVCKTLWIAKHGVTNKENNIVYSKDVNNYSLLTDSTRIIIEYTDKVKELPLEDVCSVKSAELYMVELANNVAARTEEYNNK